MPSVSGDETTARLLGVFFGWRTGDCGECSPVMSTWPSCVGALGLISRHETVRLVSRSWISFRSFLSPCHFASVSFIALSET